MTRPPTVTLFPTRRSSDLRAAVTQLERAGIRVRPYHFEALARALGRSRDIKAGNYLIAQPVTPIDLLEKLTRGDVTQADRKSTRLNSSHTVISYAVFCLRR